MHRLRTASTRSRLLVAILVATAVWVGVAALSPAPSEAGFTRCGTAFTYYSDASQTTVVGYQQWTPTACGCTYSGYGQITPFRTLSSASC